MVQKNILFALMFVASTQAMDTKPSFAVLHEGKVSPVERHWLDRPLRKMNQEQLGSFLKTGYITAHKMDNGEFNLKSHGRLRGGGPAGATVGFYAGKFLVHFVGHGTMFVVACCTGPAFPVTLASLEATFLVPLEAASNVGGLAGGIAGGVVTGPV